MALSMCVLRSVSSAAVCVITWASAGASDAPGGATKDADRIDAVLYSTRDDNKVHVLAADDLRLLASIDAQAGSHELAIDATGRFAMGSAYGGPGPNHQPADRRLIVLDLPARKHHRTITLDGIQRPNDIAFLPPGHNGGEAFEAVVTAEVPPHVLRVHAETGLVKALPVDAKHGHMLALAPDASTVYLAHVAPGSVSFLDLATSKITRSVAVPLGAEGIAIAPDGAALWVASNRSDKISVVSAVAGKVEQTIDLAGFPFRVKFSPDGALVAVSCPGSGEVAIIEAKDPARVVRVDTNRMDGKPIAAQMVPTSIAFSPDGATIFAVCSGDEPSIVAIDVAGREVRGRAKALGKVPDALACGRIQWAKE